MFTTDLDREGPRVELQAKEGDVGEESAPCATEWEAEQLGDELISLLGKARKG